MKRIVLLVGITLMSIILFACAQEVAPVEKSAPVSLTEQTEVTAKEPWQVEWEKTLALARKEGKVVVYGGDISGEMRYQLSKAFFEKYGIIAEIEAGRSVGLTERVNMERKAGLYLPDLTTGGMKTSLFVTYKPGGMVEPIEQFLILPEVKDPKYWWNGLRFSDNDHTCLVFNAYVTLAIAINTELVKEGELKSFYDLLQPRWKGKILMNDPTLPGIASSWMGFCIKVLGVDYLRGLARQEPTILRDERLHTEWLARGKFPVATTPLTVTFAEFQSLGAPIKRIEMAEGAQLTAGIACVIFMNKAPHPNAAKVFLNWLLTKEAQTIWCRIVGTQSGRLDVPTDFLTADIIRKEGIKYLDQNTEEYISQEQDFIRIAREIFRPLMK